VAAATIKEKLATGHTMTMINPGHASPSMVEFLGGLGADALFIDCEHGMAGPERVQEMCRAARVVGSAPIVRPEANRDWLITRYLDAGAAGVMVPHIETAEDARALVAAVRYARPADHASKLVVALVESVRALENLDAIAQVDGLDALFVGSGDLSNSLGLAGQRFHPDVVRRVHEAGRRIVSLGKVAGTRVTTQNAAGFAAAGFRLLYENANAFLAEGLAQFKAAAQASQR
jgi:2-keto-3-deoxy-L-rhamnonate aldolase RhmA